jgi:uncharacterized protein (DUF362 family)
MIRINEVRTAKDLEALLKDFNLTNDCYVIKPNFYKEFIGYFTEAGTLDLFLGLLKGKKYVTESYTAARTDLSKQIRPGEGRKYREWLKEQDKIFFSSTGIGDLFKKHNVEFINVTEENWAGRTVKPDIIKSMVEKKFPPVKHTELYSTVPQKLFELRSATMINLAKFKVMHAKSNSVFFTLIMKNLFGLIPEPDRADYHGKDDKGLSASINDMCKIYAAVFPDTLHILEAIHRTIISTESLTTENCKLSNPALVENLHFALASDNPVEADAYAVSLFGVDPHKRHFLNMGKEVFGGWKEENFPDTPDNFKNFFDRFK